MENTKQVLIFKGIHTSQCINDVLKEISQLSKPNCRVLNRKNEIFPLEDASSVEFLATKNNCSLFLMGSHSKKRPNNLVMGRTYDGSILDLAEFGVDNIVSINSIASFKKTTGSKPLLVFQGDQWESDSIYTRIQNLFTDFFRGDKVAKISLMGLDHVISFTVVDGVIYMRSCLVRLKKSGSNVPNVELEPMGPSMDLTLRRHQFASADLWKVACKKPKALKQKKVKNHSHGLLGEKLGRIHMKRQDFDKASGKRMAVLRDRNPVGKGKGRAQGNGGPRLNDSAESDKPRAEKRVKATTAPAPSGAAGGERNAKRRRHA